MNDLDELLSGESRELPKGSPALGAEPVARYLSVLPGWALSGDSIAKTYSFKDYHQTIAFVNAVAWIAHQENHHPDMEVGYNKLTIRYSTHTVGGLSLNDFIGAAKVERLGSL